jgi:hypothetical protein
LAGFLTSGDFLEDGSNGGILVVTACGFAPRIACEQRTCALVFQRETNTALIPGSQVGGSWEFREWAGL